MRNLVTLFLAVGMVMISIKANKHYSLEQTKNVENQIYNLNVSIDSIQLFKDEMVGFYLDSPDVLIKIINSDQYQMFQTEQDSIQNIITQLNLSN